MSYTVLARRYRSQDFEEVVGQEPIARTLKSAVQTERTAHAYLFCGTRGVGKTSMARIFARAMNVSDELTEKEAIGAAIARGDDLDVIEIDGASNRGINEARDLIAAAGLSPARCPYKIYIIDEVHALTKDAFNALLKTMEEPPSHVKFILCTTEPQRVPATIQSRCQRFDFKPIATASIADHLRRILKAEKIEADDQVVMQVAKLGNGSMRDALSLLDRLLAAGEDRLSAEMLEQMLGLPDHTMIRQLIQAMTAGEAGQVLEIGGQLLAAGVSIEQALDMLTDMFRDLMVIVSCGDDSLLVDLAPEVRQELVALAGSFDASGLVHLIAICDATSRNAQGSVTSRALFDAAIVRMSMTEHLADIPALLSGKIPAKSTPRPAAASPASKKKPLNPPPPESPTEQAPVLVATSSQKVSDEPDPVPDSSPTMMAEVKPETPPQAQPEPGELWSAVLKATVRAPMMQAVIDDLVFRNIEGSTVHLGLNEHGKQRARFLFTQKEKIEQFITKVAGRPVKVRLDMGGEPTVAPSPVSAAEAEDAQQLPHVDRAMELFDAVVVEVNDEPEPPRTPD